MATTNILQKINWYDALELVANKVRQYSDVFEAHDRILNGNKIHDSAEVIAFYYIWKCRFQGRLQLVKNTLPRLKPAEALPEYNEYLEQLKTDNHLKMDCLIGRYSSKPGSFSIDNNYANEVIGEVHLLGDTGYWACHIKSDLQQTPNKMGNNNDLLMLQFNWKDIKKLHQKEYIKFFMLESVEGSLFYAETTDSRYTSLPFDSQFIPLIYTVLQKKESQQYWKFSLLGYPDIPNAHGILDKKSLYYDFSYSEIVGKYHYLGTGWKWLLFMSEYLGTRVVTDYFKNPERILQTIEGLFYLFLQSHGVNVLKLPLFQDMDFLPFFEKYKEHIREVVFSVHDSLSQGADLFWLREVQYIIEELSAEVVIDFLNPSLPFEGLLPAAVIEHCVTDEINKSETGMPGAETDTSTGNEEIASFTDDEAIESSENNSEDANLNDFDQLRASIILQWKEAPEEYYGSYHYMKSKLIETVEKMCLCEHISNGEIISLIWEKEVEDQRRKMNLPKDDPGAIKAVWERIRRAINKTIERSLNTLPHPSKTMKAARKKLILNNKKFQN